MITTKWRFHSRLFSLDIVIFKLKESLKKLPSKLPPMAFNNIALPASDRCDAPRLPVPEGGGPKPIPSAVKSDPLGGIGEAAWLSVSRPIASALKSGDPGGRTCVLICLVIISRRLLRMHCWSFTAAELSAATVMNLICYREIQKFTRDIAFRCFGQLKGFRNL